MAVRDQLVTEFLLKENYTQKQSAIDGATKAIVRDIDEVEKKAAGLGPKLHKALSFNGQIGSISTAFGGAISGFAGMASSASMALTAVTALGAGIAYTGFKAMQSAASFDTLERTFAGALGSVNAGKQMMAALDEYAAKSAFSLDALANAAKQLAAGGLDVGRYLPVIERFALVISGVDPQGLQEVAGALIRAKGGGFGEAMEQFRRAGVGAPEFRAAGININKGGEVMSTPEEFLKAIQAISEGRLKAMADAVSGGAETQISNAGDAIGRAFRILGAELNYRFLPIVQAGTEEFSFLINSGAIQSVTQAFVDLFPALGGTDGMKGAVDAAVEALAKVPGVIQTLGTGIRMVIDLLEHSPAFITADLATRLVTGGKGLKDALDDVYVNQYTAGNLTPDERRQISKNRPKTAVAFPTVPDIPSASDVTSGAGTNIVDQAINSLLAMAATSNPIDRNTEAVKANTASQERVINLNKQLQGGGAYAEAAVSELAISRSTKHTGRYHASGLAPELAQAMQLIQEYAGRMGTEIAATQGKRLRQAGAF